jgi:hypothetical protein
MSGLSALARSSALLLVMSSSLSASVAACNRADGGPVEATRRFVDTALALGEQPLQPTRRALVGLLCSERKAALEKTFGKVVAALPEAHGGREGLSVADLVTGVRFPAGNEIRSVELASQDQGKARVLVVFEGEEGSRSMAAVDLVMEEGRWRPCPPGLKRAAKP